MRRFIAILSTIVILQAGLACKHVGGKCDCGPGPGDATSYTTTPTTGGKMMGGTSLPGSYEGIPAPKAMPK